MGTAVALYFDVTSDCIRTNRGYLQLCTRYWHPSQQLRVRVTTVSHTYARAGLQLCLTGCDPEVAAVLLARSILASPERDAAVLQDLLDLRISQCMQAFSSWEDE